MLRPQYTRRPTEILLVGPPACGKRTLATQLLKSDNVFFYVNTAETLPRESLGGLVRIDYVLLMADMTNKNSLTTLAHSLHNITPEYLSTKCAIVVTKMDRVKEWAFDEVQLKTMVESFMDIQMFHVNLQNDLERRSVCKQIAKLIRLSALQQRGVQSSMIQSLEYYRPLTTSARDDSLTEASLINDSVVGTRVEQSVNKSAADDEIAIIE